MIACRRRRRGHTQTRKNRRKRLPQLVPLLCAGRRGKAVAATVLFDVSGNVLPRELGAASTVICSFCAELLGVSYATAEEPDLLEMRLASSTIVSVEVYLRRSQST